MLILANEEALGAKKRFLETDLNRSFPGRTDGSHEERLAFGLLPFAKASRFLLDIHTTTSDIRMTPIVTRLSEDVRRIINLTESTEIALMDKDLADRSLIGQTAAGVSLEFNEDYALTEQAYLDVLRVIDGIMSGHANPGKPRLIYHVTGTIPKTIAIPDDSRNFRYIQELDAYPFLLHERAYPDLHALKATRVDDERI